MCGRFALYSSSEKIIQRFNVDLFYEIQPRYNIAPSQNVLFLLQTNDGIVHAEQFRWGLIPFFAKDLKDYPALINARSETVATKPTFKNNFKSKRGIIIMDGYFEWMQTSTIKQPYYISQKNGELLAIAALWESWKANDDEIIYSCCMITAPANPLTENFHDRMPVILTEKNRKIWLNNDEFVEESLSSALTTYLIDDLTCYPVTPKMNNPRYNDLHAIKPLE